MKSFKEYFSVIEEGLTTTYPIKVVRRLIDDGGIKIPNAHLEYDKPSSGAIDSHSIDLWFKPKEHKNIEELKRIVAQKLDSYGWFINGWYNSDYPDKLEFNIEPKFPIPLTPEEKVKGNFYHITHRKYLPKIQRVGLTPRESQTHFHHPGGRIYLIQYQTLTDPRTSPKSLARTLATSKHRHFKNQDPERYERSWQHGGEYSEENMVLLKVDLPANITAYKDPLLSPEGKENYQAIFVTSNIPPKDIVVVDFPAERDRIVDIINQILGRE